jgi:hypothetical protein
MQKQIGSTFWRRWALLVSTAFVVVSLAACDVTQTKEAELPDVDVDVKKGQMPEYEVETADIDVEKKTAKVPYPDVEVDVKKKEAEVSYPDIDIEMPGEKKAREKAAEAQVEAAEAKAEAAQERARN